MSLWLKTVIDKTTTFEPKYIYWTFGELLTARSSFLVSLAPHLCPVTTFPCILCLPFSTRPAGLQNGCYFAANKSGMVCTVWPAGMSGDKPTMMSFFCPRRPGPTKSPETAKQAVVGGPAGCGGPCVCQRIRLSLTVSGAILSLSLAWLNVFSQRLSRNASPSIRPLRHVSKG